MAVEITLSLPEIMVEQAKRFGRATKRDWKAVLTDALELSWPTLGELPDTSLYPPVSSMSDADVVELAISKMDVIQNDRLGDLQAKGKQQELAQAERYELMALLQIYQLGQLRKAEALAEVVRRGLPSPINS